MCVVHSVTTWGSGGGNVVHCVTMKGEGWTYQFSL